MRNVPLWRRYLRFFGSDVVADVRDELEFHFECKVEELKEQGWPPEQARTEALRQFGDVIAVQRVCESVATRRQKQMRISECWAALCQDVKYGVTQLRHSLGTTLLVLLTLGLGMGAVTAAFSILYAVVLRPLPFPAPDQLVSVWSVRQGIDDVVTPRNFDSWQRQAHSFRRMGAIQPTTFTLSKAGTAAQIPGGFASAGYFPVFGVTPELGRTFTAEEDRAPRLHLVILGDQLWRERFGGDRGILGQQIHLNREAFTVVGVMPASFSVRPGSEQVWVPLALSGQEMNWTGGILQVVGRLRSGLSIKEAQAEINVLARNLEALYPDMNRNKGIRVRNYADDLVGDYKSRLFILLSAVGLVLLIACANVANLLLAKTTGRKQELAVRAAMGATRARVIRQLLTESLIIAFVGAILGLCLAQVLVHLVTKLNLATIPRLDQAGINAPVFLFALCLGFLSTIFAGLLPAFRAAQVDIQTVLRQGGRGATGLARDSARSAYIAAEVALALVLLISAGLLIRTAIAAQRVQPSFSPDSVMSGRTALPTAVYRDAKDVSRAYENILQHLREQPGVVSAALTSKVPLSLSTVGLSLIQNAIAPPLKQDLATELHYISDGYLATMRIPLKRGREFTPHDRADSTQVILVSDGLAHRLWPGGQAVGEIIRIPELEGRNKAWQVVGVVADVQANGLLSEAPPVIYIPLEQVTTNPWHWIEQSLYLVARTRTEAISMSGLLQRALNQGDPELPLGDVRTMNQRLARSASLARFYTLVLTLLGACGLLLTTAGVYGVVAYIVSRQRAEIGVRLALGSSARGVLLLVIRQGMRPVLLGVTVGLLASLMTTRLLASQLYGVSATDPVTLLGVTLILILVALFACYLPARQAARLDPMVALRNE